MELITFGDDILAMLPNVLVNLLAISSVLYIAHRFRVFHEVTLGLCGITAIGLLMIVTGTSPISPESHDVLVNMVEEDPNLNNSIYKMVNDGLYISMNDQELLFSSWEHVYKKSNTE